MDDVPKGYYAQFELDITGQSARAHMARKGKRVVAYTEPKTVVPLEQVRLAPVPQTVFTAHDLKREETFARNKLLAERAAQEDVKRYEARQHGRLL